MSVFYKTSTGCPHVGQPPPILATQVFRKVHAYLGLRSAYKQEPSEDLRQAPCIIALSHTRRQRRLNPIYTLTETESHFEANCSLTLEEIDSSQPRLIA